tara:strand:+ start:72 stop:590 length:519 start_codon:yes stop_codon:yes gene_type:complete
MDKIACIYKIKHKLDCDDENIYIGSTYDLNDRISKHKSSCNNERDTNYNFKIYKYMRDNGGYDNFEYSILRLCEDEDKADRHKLEQSFIDVHRPTLNTKNAKGLNYEKMKKWKKEWYEANKDEINEKKRTEKIECDCGSIVGKNMFTRHKKTKKHLEHLEDEKIALRLLNGY